MNHYAITQLHFEDESISRVLLHKVDSSRADEFGLHEGKDTTAADLADFLERGDRVHLAKADGAGSYVQLDEVKLAHESKVLVAISFEGKVTDLRDLPTY